MQCIIDGSLYAPPISNVDLLALCNADAWVLAQVVADLVAAGVPNVAPEFDAWEFSYHCFAIHANGPGFDPKRKLSERQHNILTCA